MENTTGNNNQNSGSFDNPNNSNNPFSTSNTDYNTAGSSSSSDSNLSGSSLGAAAAGATSLGGSSLGNTSGSGSTFGNSNSGGTSRMMTGMFRDRASAERAYSSLQSRGYSKDDVNLVMSDDTRKKHFGDHTPDSDLGDKALEGAGAGSAIGGTLGAIVGAVAAIGTSVALPGLGLIIAGPLAAGLAGAGAGGLTGGLLGALVGSGIPEDHAKEYESGVKDGGIVMGVHPRTEEDAHHFENEWRNSHGESIYR
ncbi:hypothetical protein [Adhaeribacter pallidiroseus]|uniref:Sericin n=1 Tax=Adhaeribacter pallidiroseus TaxID=2072847 RepID=A0A369QCF8_9BACT|nr:hypothetical protein [Adhaeribacter pallidiroseus]RDC62384.1 Sericin [Adhaeribacter pallidiroseus]